MTSCNGYRVSLTDEDVAKIIIAASEAASPSGGWALHRRKVIASAIAAGREIGQRLPLEPLDDGLRTVALAAAQALDGQGLNGMTGNLRRLDAFLQRYPSRGIPDLPSAPEQPA